MSRTQKIEASIAQRGTKQTGKPEEVSICCPFCSTRAGKTDFSFKLQYNTNKGAFYCYRCDAKGYAAVPSLGVRKVKAPSAPGQDSVANPPTVFSLPADFVYLAEAERSQALRGVFSQYKEYLMKRDAYATATAVRAGFCWRGKYTHRIVFPIGKDGCDGFTARTIIQNDTRPKYLNPPGMNRRSLIYGPFHAFQSYSNTPRYVVEGVFDALALYPHGVATFGKNVTDEQLLVLAKQSTVLHSTYFCLDGDAWEEAQYLSIRYSLMGGKGEVYWAKLPPGKDPAELGWDVAKYIRNLVDEPK